jgi:CTP:phosphocholine cytidylyltransferase-like protein
MFANTGLIKAPELLADQLVLDCYAYMFYNCKKLNYIKALFTTTPSSTYTNNWVTGVSSTGTFIKNTNATWNVTGISGIPTGWTV